MPYSTKIVAVEDVRQIYEYCYRKVFSTNPTYKFVLPDDKLPKVEKFLSALGEINNRYLFDYLAYQFQYYDWMKGNTEFRGNFGSVTIEFMVGPKALKRWKEKPFLNNSEIFRKYNLSYLEFSSVYHEAPLEFSKTHAEIRARMVNTERGFIQCLLFTNLWCGIDPSCVKCTFAAECKAMLKVKYPALYHRRNAQNNESKTKRVLRS